ncbi:DNA or RNA helicases of superfamily II [Streptococcus pneumoniae]|nr:DNA or RNA helicases of superfamily II [Streptococcus pneumoniae]
MCFTHSFFHFATLRKSLQTINVALRSQVQPAARFLVCSLIFIEY